MKLKELKLEIPLIRDVLEESNVRARENRAVFDQHGILVMNIMSSPGSGKTSVLQKTIPILQEQDIICAVIEGDITSTLDSERLQPLNIQIVQANTEPFGGDCHLGSHLVQGALKFLDLSSINILFIENIGNLVCPAEFYLGEDRKVVILSITEGEDKPIKYPLMFRECDLCLLNKMDLMPYLEINVDLLKSNIKKINHQMTIIPVSAKTGEGISEWIDWLLAQKNAKLSYGH
jgi:hydrogenase nickel incorporation protein HypB